MTALGGSEVFKLFGTIEVGRQKFAGDMAAMEKRVTGFAAKVTQGFAKATAGIERHRGAIQSVGRGMTAGVTLPLLAAGAAALKFSTDFSGGLANVATLLPGETERVRELGGAIKVLSVESGKGLGDLTEGLYQVVSAFGDAADSEQKLQVVTKAGVAGRAGTVEALNLLSAVTKGYGDTSATAMEHVSDLAFTTVRLGQTTFPELASSMGRVIPLAQSMGISMEEMFAVMATGTGVTGTANEVGTQFRGVLNALMNPQKQMIELLEKHEYASGKAMIADLGLVGTLELIAKEAKAGGFQMIQYVSQVEALPIVLALTGAQADTFKAKLGELSDVTGASAEAFETQTTGINKSGFALAQLKSRVTVIATELGDVLAPALIDVVDAGEPVLRMIQTAIQRFRELSPETQKSALGFVAFMAALGPILLILPSFIASLGAAAAVLGGSIGVVVALVAVTTALLYGRTHWIRYWQAANQGKQILADEIQAHVELKIAIGREVQARNDLTKAQAAHWDAGEKGKEQLLKAQAAHDVAVKQLGAIETKYYRLATAAKESANAQAAADKALLDVDGEAAAAAAKAAAAKAAAAKAAEEFTTRVEAAQESVAKLKFELSLLSPATAAYAQTTEELNAATKELNVLLAPAASYMNALTKAEQEAAQTTKAWAEAQDYLWEALGGAEGVAAVEALRAANSEAAQSVDLYLANARAMEEWKASTGGFEGLTEAMVAEEKRQLEAITQTAIDQAEWFYEQLGGDEGLAQYEAAKEAADKAEKENKDRAEATAKAWELAAERIQTSLANAFTKIALEGGKFNDVLKTVWDTMKTAFVESLAAMVAAWIAAKMKMLAMKLVTSLFGIPLFGDGTIVTQPTLAVLGDKGPEAAIPLSGPVSPALAQAAAPAVLAGLGRDVQGSVIRIEDGAIRVNLSVDDLTDWQLYRLTEQLVDPLSRVLTARLAEVTA